MTRKFISLSSNIITPKSRGEHPGHVEMGGALLYVPSMNLLLYRPVNMCIALGYNWVDLALSSDQTFRKITSVRIKRGTVVGRETHGRRIMQT